MSSSSSTSYDTMRDLPSARFSLQTLFSAVKEQDRSKGDLLAQSTTKRKLHDCFKS